jgi:hypothetical protein
MGMDLVPFSVKDKTDEENIHFHANWSGWSAIASMLSALDVDMTLFSGSNDGDEVPAEIAESWGRAVEENFDNLYVLNVEELHGPDWARGRTLILPGTGYDLIKWSQYRGENGDLDVTIRRMRDCEHLAQFIRHFAKFCRNSGGFAQY